MKYYETAFEIHADFINNSEVVEDMTNEAYSKLGRMFFKDNAKMSVGYRYLDPLTGQVIPQIFTEQMPRLKLHTKVYYVSVKGK